MKKRSISVINTGIQLINVIEAIQFTNCEDNYLIIGQFNIFPERIKQIEKMLEDEFLNHHFTKIYSLPKQYSAQSIFRFLGYILAFLKISRIILSSKKFDYCFSGVYTDLIQRPVNFLSHFKNKNINLWLIDEGIRVIKDVQMRKNQIAELEIQDKRMSSWVRDFYYGFTKKWLPPELTYFSAYQLHVAPRDHLIQNKYEFFKKNNLYRYRFEENAVILIGQPFVELKRLRLEKYVEILKSIFTSYNDFPVYYMPHPLETIYPNYIPVEVKIIKTQYPVELLLLGNQLKCIIGFNSSVLINASKMQLCDKIISYAVNPKDQIVKENKNNEELLSLFKDAGIQLIYL